MAASAATKQKLAKEVNVPAMTEEEAAAWVKQQSDATVEQLSSFGPRILVMGATGVGKSSVLNACFGKHLAVVGHGTPCTGYGQGSQAHLVNYFPASVECPVHLYDTKGFEPLSDNKDILAAVQEVVSTHAANAAEKPFNSPEYHAERIHCVWWIVDDRCERSLIDAVTQMLESANVPVLVVVNKCDRPKDEVDIMLSAIRGEVPSAKNVLPFVSTTKNGPIRMSCPSCGSDDLMVRAKGRTFQCECEDCPTEGKRQPLLDSYGVQELISATHQLLPEIVAASFHDSQKIWLDGMDGEAEKWIQIHTGIAGTVGLSPIPFSDAPLLLANEVAMIIKLANIYSLPVNERSVKQWIVSLAGMGALAGLGYGVAQLFKFMPGVGTVLGGGTSCAIAMSFTYGIGELVAELFRRVRGAALFGEVTEETFKQVMGVDEQKAFLKQKMSEWYMRRGRDVSQQQPPVVAVPVYGGA